MVINPVVQFDAIRKATTNDVHDSKMAANWVVDVLDIMMTREHVTNHAFFQKVDACDFISIYKHIFSLLTEKRFEKRTDISNK